MLFSKGRNMYDFYPEFSILLELNQYRCKQDGSEKGNSKHFRDLILISYYKKSLTPFQK